MDIKEMIGTVAVIIVVLFIAIFLGQIFVDMSSDLGAYFAVNHTTRAFCISHGYPDYYVINGEGYCERMEDGTTIILSVKEIEKMHD